MATKKTTLRELVKPVDETCGDTNRPDPEGLARELQGLIEGQRGPLVDVWPLAGRRGYVVLCSTLLQALDVKIDMLRGGFAVGHARPSGGPYCDGNHHLRLTVRAAKRIALRQSAA